jgi:hypothetical protein
MPQPLWWLPTPSPSTCPGLTHVLQAQNPVTVAKDYLVSSPATRYPNRHHPQLTGRRAAVGVSSPLLRRPRTRAYGADDTRTLMGRPSP